MNELYHHGVKGMKWGVRRSSINKDKNTQLGKRIKAGVRAAIEDYTKDKTKGQIAVDTVMSSIGTAILIGGAIVKGKEMMNDYVAAGKTVVYEILDEAGETIYTKYL